jgi:uncharacterized MAPEG superfamily protein
MPSLIENVALRYYAIASTVLALHLIALALWTGTVRAKKKQYVNPEDATLNKGANTPSDHPDVERVKRAHANAVENAIPFFVVGALYAVTGATATGALAYYGAFAGARLLHTLFYLAGRQPFRTLCFLVGVLAVVGMGVHVLRVAI